MHVVRIRIGIVINRSSLAIPLIHDETISGRHKILERTSSAHRVGKRERERRYVYFALKAIGTVSFQRRRCGNVIVYV